MSRSFGTAIGLFSAPLITAAGLLSVPLISYYFMSDHHLKTEVYRRDSFDKYKLLEECNSAHGTPTKPLLFYFYIKNPYLINHLTYHPHCDSEYNDFMKSFTKYQLQKNILCHLSP